MALTDISRVTEAITSLVGQVIDARDSMPEAFEISAGPPEDDTVASPNVVSVHLFHIAEDPHRKNLPPLQAVSGSTPVQFSRMGVVLDYVVTARNASGANGSDRALAEQRLLGYVARALHDFPVITDETQIPPNPPILQGANLSGADNQIQILFRPVGVDEVVNFWSAEQALTARLSLFYEARVILLDSPPPPSVPGVVYSVGSYTFAADGPRLTRIHNVVGFVPPAGFGTIDPSNPFVRVASDPARASLFVGGAPPPSVHPRNNHAAFEGEGFVGTRVSLGLFGPAVISAEPYAERSYRIDLTRPADNPAWNIALSGTSVELDVRSTATDDQGRPVELFPGLHRAKIVTLAQAPADQTGRLIERSSNEIWFAITPQVVDVASNGGPPNARSFTLTLLGAYLGPDLRVEVAVGGRALTRAAGPLGAGMFDFVDGTGQIGFIVDTTGDASPLPIRLQINGAEATPAWAVF